MNYSIEAIPECDVVNGSRKSHSYMDIEVECPECSIINFLENPEGEYTEEGIFYTVRCCSCNERFRFETIHRTVYDAPGEDNVQEALRDDQGVEEDDN